ncbi:MAG TPA: cyclic nucleotide-binding domain-containing protein [Verrucomicrobiae bacterium]|nr:cyclic nucleotide-binding domain-containing protein [Verrucomicrobiae bacterium]
MSNLTGKITRHPFFNGMKPEHMALAADCVREAAYQPGETLIRAGEPADSFFLIESGRVALEAHEPADGNVLIQELGIGEVLGWSWLFPPFSWQFTARAIEPTTVLVLSGAHLLVEAEKNHDFGFELMKRVSQVAIRRLQATRKRLLDAHLQSLLEG